MRALQAGCKQIIEALYADVDEPYEKIYLLPYDSNCQGIEIRGREHFEQQVQGLYAGGGTHFYNSFLAMQTVLEQKHQQPGGLNEATIIFMTDGCDNYNPPNKKELYESWSTWLKELNGVQSRILAVGLSRQHDANQMNEIANFGNEVGNFIFVDTYEEGW